jgi:LPS-assembly protein
VNVEYRERFYSGVMDIRAGATDDYDFTSGGTKFGQDTARSYILGSGQFNISSDWQWGFTAERTSDKLLFEKYAVYDVFADRGLYAADGGRLISQLDTVRQDQDSYLSIAAVSVQGLRPTDIQSTIPTIAPLIEARIEPSEPVLGGRLRLDASAVALTRDQAPSLTGAPGVDSRRATAQLDWRTAFTLADGLRIQPFILGRADLYNVGDLAAPYASNATIPRAFGTVGADISYPLIKQTSDITYILEPMAQVAISPNTKLDPRIPDEDSEVWQFDDTNLFDVNKSPGYDLYEGGQMLTLGGRATALLPDGRSGSLIIGRSLRAEADPDIPVSTGLQTPLSDWIIGAEVTPIKGITVFSHWRLDTSTLAINRVEAGVNFATSRASGYVSYLQEAQSPLGGKITSLDMHGEVFPLKHWGATVYAIVDGGTWRQSDLGLVYRDDCIRVEVLYRRNETYNGTLGPSTSVILRLSFATSALSGYTH